MSTSDLESMEEEDKHETDERKEEIGEDIKTKETDDKRKRKNMKKKTKNRIDKIISLLEKAKINQEPFDKCVEKIKNLMPNDKSEWITPIDSKNKEKAIENITQELQNLKKKLSTKDEDELEPIGVINASSILAGKYVTQNIHDWIKKRRPLVSVPNDVQFKLPTIFSKDEAQEFDDKWKKDTFDKLLEQYGWDCARNLQAAVMKIGVRGGYVSSSETEKEEEKIGNVAKYHYSKTTCSIDPVALWEPSFNQMSFSENALKSLKTLDAILDIDKSEDIADKFFQEFGSHIYVGDVHFGGIFKTSTTYESERVADENSIKKLVASQHSTHLEGAYKTWWAQVEGGLSDTKQSGTGNNEGKSEEKDIYNVQRSITTLGGPSCANVLPLWKIGLHNSNRTWVVIDVEMPELKSGNINQGTYIGVWNLVEKEKSNFENASRLSQFLMKRWEHLTQLQEKDTSYAEICNIFSKKRDLQECIENIMKQMKAECQPDNIAELIENLQGQVQEMCKDQRGQEIWKSELTRNTNIHNVFKKIMSFKLSEVKRLEVGRSIKKLLIASTDFPEKQELIKWLDIKQHTSSEEEENIVEKNQLSTVEEFITFLFKTYETNIRLKQLNKSPEFQRDFSKQITSELAAAVIKLLTKFQVENNVFSYVFLLACFVNLDFNPCESAFKCQVTVERIVKFNSLSNETVSMYREWRTMNIKVQQARAFHLLATNINKHCTYTNPPSYFHKIAQLVKAQFSQLDADIDTILNTSTNELNSILNTLDDLANGRLSETNVLCWKYFENTTIKLCREQTDTEQSNCLPSTFASKMLKWLGLDRYFPRKLSVQTALSIRDNDFTDENNALQIPWVVLRKIVSTNYEFREKVLFDFFSKMSKHWNDKNDYMYDLLSKTKQKKNINEDEDLMTYLHPQDMFLIIFQCCNPFLQRLVVQKTNECKLAVPLIYPEISQEKNLRMSLWSFRDIFVDNESECVVNLPLKSIAFVRFGEALNHSKSGIINRFMRNYDELHHTFFHKDLLLGSRERKLSDGLIEASWFIPSNANNEVEKITEPLTILNLRGDGVTCSKQMPAILMLSNIIVVLIKFTNLSTNTFKENLQQIYESKCSVLILTDVQHSNDNDQSIETYFNETKKYEGRITMLSAFNSNNKPLNERDFIQMIKYHIIRLLENVKEGIILKKKSSQLNVTIDDSEKCNKARKMAKDIVKKLQVTDMSRCKENYVPLQGGNLWLECSKKQKDLNRPKSQRDYDTEETLLKSINQIRRDQVEACNKHSNVLASFVHALAEVIGDKDETQYFLAWMRQRMDDVSRVVLQPIFKKIKDATRDHQSDKKGSAETTEQLDKFAEELERSSFGLEHLFREIGQIYEAFILSKDTMHCTIAQKTLHILMLLPVIAAKVLLLGEPLEVMDGDAANVPLRWIKSVFDELQTLIGDKKLCTISVLGVQSTGKSTLLNTMFGLRFAVSAGRCTRGIYAQIIEVDRQQSKLKCDYVLVLDTEGLCAPELARKNLNHDNELATFVIGLADLVLINTKGESITELTTNVLDIVLLELIRLRRAYKNLTLKQRGMFIHQNISFQDERLVMIGRQKLMDSLDKIAKEAAQQENVAGVEQFKDVIKFTPSEDIISIPDLRKGNDAMSPVSPHYSQAVTTIAKYIIEKFALSEQSFLSPKNKFIHLESLWQGILAEDFVFSFRNGLEVKAYTLLESEYQKLSSKLDMLAFEWMTNNIRPYLCKQSQLENLDNTSEKLMEDFVQKINAEHSIVEERLSKFIKQSELPELMIQWENHKITCLSNKAEILKQEAEIKINEEKERYRNDIIKMKDLVDKEKEINAKAKSLAPNWKDMDEGAIVDAFNKMWNTWFNELAPETLAVENNDEELKNALILVLTEKFQLKNKLIRTRVKKNDLNWPSQTLKLKYSMKEDEIKTGLNDSTVAKVIRQLDRIFETIDMKFALLRKQDARFQKAAFSSIVEEIRVGFENFSAQNTSFRLPHELEIDVAVHVTKFAFAQFKTINTRYEERNGLQNKLQQYKPRALALFMDVCRARSNEIVAANLLFSEIKNLIKERICRQLQIFMQKVLIERYMHQKHYLMKQVMTDLARKCNFERFMDYIENPSLYVLQWIQNLTDRVVFEEKDTNKPSLYMNWNAEYLKELIDHIIRAVKCVSAEFTGLPENERNIAEWKNIFMDKLNAKNLMLTGHSFMHVTEIIVSDFNAFSDSFLTKLLSEEDKLQEELNELNPRLILWEGKTPYEYIFDKLWGCKEKCPFCYEPCQRSDSTHASLNDCHMCIQHRPEGIAGIHGMESKKLTIESCNFLVQSEQRIKCDKWCVTCSDDDCNVYHPYKDYKQYVNNWDISPKSDMSVSVYWNWFMAKFCKNLSDYYMLKLPEIPESWKTITYLAAIESLDNVYKS